MSYGSSEVEAVRIWMMIMELLMTQTIMLMALNAGRTTELSSC